MGFFKDGYLNNKDKKTRRKDGFCKFVLAEFFVNMKTRYGHLHHFLFK